MPDSGISEKGHHHPPIPDLLLLIFLCGFYAYSSFKNFISCHKASQMITRFKIICICHFKYHAIKELKVVFVYNFMATQGPVLIRTFARHSDVTF